MADNDQYPIESTDGTGTECNAYIQPETELDAHEKLIEALQLQVDELTVEVIRLKRLMGQLATAAIASTAAFDVLRQFMHDQTGLGGAAVFDFDTEGD